MCSSSSRSSSSSEAATTSSSSMTSSPSPPASAAAAGAAAYSSVPDTILSLVKDDRYTTYLSSLLFDVLIPHIRLPSSSSLSSGTDDTDGVNQAVVWSIVQPELRLLASVIHFLFITWKTGRTLGMDYLGLEFCSDVVPTDNRRRGRKEGVSAASNSSDEMSPETTKGRRRDGDTSRLSSMDVPSPSGGGGRTGSGSGSVRRQRHGDYVGDGGINSSSSNLKSALSLPPYRDHTTMLSSLPYGKAIVFGLFYVLPPYLIQRAGRGGWDDLKALIRHCLFSRRAADASTAAAERSATNGMLSYDNNNQHQHDSLFVSSPFYQRGMENLHGMERRRAYEEQRRRMLERADRIVALEEGSVEEEAKEEEKQNEGLGDDLLTDETEAQSSLSRDVGQERHHTDNGVNQSSTRGFTAVIDRLWLRSWNVLRRIAVANASMEGGPHTLPPNNNNNNNTAIQANLNTTTTMDRYALLIKWLLRVHLAIFYLNGRYPTLLHRLFGIRILDRMQLSDQLDDGQNNNDSIDNTQAGKILHSTVANRPSYKVIGMLILMQASAALAKGTTHVFVEILHSLRLALERRRRRRQRLDMTGARRRRNDIHISGQTSSSISINSRQREQEGIHFNGEQSTTSNNEPDDTETLHESLTSVIEERVPSIVSRSSTENDGVASTSQGLHSQRSPSNTFVRYQGGLERRTLSHCAICMNERIHPAAPCTCGHVFCWNCIHYWVTNVRAECPLCRSRTRPQDIIALYHYTPTT